MSRSVEGMDDSQRQQYFIQLAQLAQVNYQQQLLNSATTVCNAKCMDSTNPTISQKEKLCVLKCVDRFRDAEKVCERKFSQELVRQQQQQQSGSYDEDF